MRKSDFEFNNIPQAYLITFRGYGTWLHGDKRGSVDRTHNRFGSPRLMPNERRRQLNLERLKHKPVRLAEPQRLLVEGAIGEICKKRHWDLWVVNARTNHIHAVVTAPCKPEPVLTALKAKATRKLREAGYCRNGESPWAKRGSKRYLWTEQDVIDAVVYVQYDQGE
jgi:REP element-mobilizing transposase RayT